MIGDLIFVKGHKLLDKAIEWFDDGSYSHIAISITEDDSMILEAQYGERSCVRPFYFSDYDIVHIGLSEEQKQKVPYVVEKLKNHNYDLSLILGEALDDLLHIHIANLFNSSNEYICSELSELFLLGVGWITQDEFIRGITPNKQYRFVTEKLKKKVS